MKYVAVLMLCLLTACKPDAGLSDYIELAGYVPPAAVDTAVAEMEECLKQSMPYSLKNWTFRYAADYDSTSCPGAETFDCYPILGDQCLSPDWPGRCGCRCGGVTRFQTREVVVTPGLYSLKHEIHHAGWGVISHDENPAGWACSRL